MSLDFKAIEDQVAAGYIRVQRHPSENLRLYNYTIKAQMEWHWTPETRACRGLIVDDNDRIVARPFEKFFSYDQLGGVVPDEPFEAFEKLDGSLGILYWVDGLPCIATRGSFTSEQAKAATLMVRQRIKYQCLRRDLTYLFEIIYPENRIVVDYGDKRDIVLLAVIANETGAEVPIDEYDGLFSLVPRYQFASLSDLLKEQDASREGFVLRFQSGMRVKVKFEEYKRLHKLLTGTNAGHVWEMLRDGKSIETLLERVPDDYTRFIRAIAADLRTKYSSIEEAARSAFKNDFIDRKAAAEYIKTQSNPGILFSMLDGKDYSRQIWKMVEPRGASSTFFRCGDDG